MKIKLVVLDLELSRRARRLAIVAAIGLLALGIGAVAYASVPHAWSDGETLGAADLNGNFAALDGRAAAADGRVAALEGRLGTVDGRVAALERPAPRSAVLAHKTVAQTLAARTESILTFGSEAFDVNHEFDPSSGTFTAAHDGFYHIDCAALFNGVDSGCVLIDVVQDGGSVAQNAWCGTLGANTISISTVVHLAPSGTLSCHVTNQLAANESVGGAQSWEIARNYIAISSVP
jgi:hypothetical protein